MAFRFGMQQVLEYRQGLEDRGKEELARRKRILDEANRKLEMLEDEQDKTMQLWREHSSGTMDIYYLHDTAQYMQSLTGNIQKQVEKKSKCCEKLEEQRAVVKKCWQERRIMEILKDKSYQDYKKEEQKIERSVNDELALKNYLRKQGSGDFLF